MHLFEAAAKSKCVSPVAVVLRLVNLFHLVGHGLLGLGDQGPHQVAWGWLVIISAN